MKRVLIGLGLALIVLLVPVGSVFALTSANVTVTATPSFISISNDPNTWVLNGIAGNSKIAPNTRYYAHATVDTTIPASPVVDGDCRFTITNTSNVVTTLTVNISHFTGGDAMQNGNGTNGANSYAAWAYCTGMTTYATDKKIANTTGSTAIKTDLAATTNLKWGAEILTQTGDWASAAAETAYMIITATAS